MHPVRLTPAGRGPHGLRAVPRDTARGRTGTVCRAAGGQPVRSMRGDHVRRRRALRPMRRPGGRAPSAKERRQPQTLRRATGAGALHRLRTALAGGGKMRTLRAPVLRTLGPLLRHPHLAGPVHGHRDRDGRGARDVREPGRGRRLPRLRQVVLRSGRGARRRLAHAALHGLVVAASATTVVSRFEPLLRWGPRGPASVPARIANRDTTRSSRMSCAMAAGP